MKRTLFSILFIIGILSMMAQQNLRDMLDSGTNHTRFGVRIAWDRNMPSTSFNNMVSTYHSGSGLSGGAFVNIPIIKNLYLEPGLNFYYNTMVISQNIRDNLRLDYPLTREGSLRNSGIRIPCVFGYRIEVTDDVALSVFTGPQMNIGVTFQEYEKGSRDKVNLYDHGWHRCDAQWLFGLRFYYIDNWMAEICGGIGMTNLLDKDQFPNQNFRRNTFSVSVGYLF